jgi:hypothetical protein
MIGKMDLCSVLTCSVNVSLFLDCIFCYEIFALLYFIWPFFNLVAEIRRNKHLNSKTDTAGFHFTSW